MPTAIAKVKTAALSKELSEPLPEPPTFEGKPGVRSIAGDLGDQFVYLESSLTHTDFPSC